MVVRVPVDARSAPTRWPRARPSCARVWREPRPFATDPWCSVPGSGGHELAVAAARERIHAGDLFQANVCLRLESRLEGDPLDLFAAGVEALAPDRAAFVGGADGVAVASLSPELFLERRGRRVRTAPIKGTRPALGRPGRAGALGQGPGREHDDRGPDAQRPRARVRRRAA